MKSFKTQCIELRKKDHTLNEIVKITGRSKTSVYFHIKDIPLSEKKREEIKDNTRHLAVQLAASRKGKALNRFTPFKKWTPKRVLLVAHLIFDGEIRRSSCGYSNRSTALIKRVETLFRDVYDHSVHRHLDKRSGVHKIYNHNVELGQFMMSKSKELLEVVPKLSRACQKEFIRAFFDDEGCMDVRLDKNKRRIRGYQNDKNILLIVQNLLKNFGIESKLQGRNEVVITGKENLIKFQKEINFSKGVRLNPNRTNSIWKKDIEKRKLLDIAIKSFKT